MLVVDVFFSVIDMFELWLSLVIADNFFFVRDCFHFYFCHGQCQPSILLVYPEIGTVGIVVQPSVGIPPACGQHAYPKADICQ